MRCPECGHENEKGLLLCANCHADIYDVLVAEMETKQLQRDSSAIGDLRLAEPPSSRPVLLYIGTQDLPISIERLNNLIIGRKDPNAAQPVNIDLSPYDAQELGVSRNHARIDARREPPILYDLNSSNGTFLNDERLEPEKPYSLSSGDEIKFGRLTVRVFYK